MTKEQIQQGIARTLHNRYVDRIERSRQNHSPGEYAEVRARGEQIFLQVVSPWIVWEGLGPPPMAMRAEDV